MKTTMLALAALMAMQGHAASLDGKWYLRSRTCFSQSGATQPSDAFDIAKDRMSLEIHGQQANVTTVFGDTYYAFFGTLSSDFQTFLYQTNNGFDQSRILVQDENTIDILDANFGPGGSCAPGATMNTVFARAQSCLADVEVKKLDALTAKLEAAKKTKPGCESAYGAAACLSPSELSLMSFLKDRQAGDPRACAVKVM